MKHEMVLFINWLKQRLINKHNYSIADPIIINLEKVEKLVEPKSVSINLSDDDLDMILGKYYVDFHLDKTDDLDIGFTEPDRKRLRFTTRCIVHDIVNKDIPSKNLIS
jgi:hypothetical protein